MKAFRAIVYGILFAAVIGLLAYTYTKTGTIDASTLVKAGLILVGLILSLLRSGRRSPAGKSVAVYRKAYAAFVSDAFLEDKKLERKFFSAVDDYNRSRYSQGLRKLTALRGECTGSRELYAVTVFMALCSDDAGLYDDAIRHYDAAIKIRPNGTLYSNLGLCYQRKGRFDLAHDALEHAVALDSHNAIAWNNLSALLFREGEYEGALNYAREALKRNAALPQALSTAAICCGLLGQEEEYQKYYRQAVANGYDGNKIKSVLNSLSSTR